MFVVIYRQFEYDLQTCINSYNQQLTLSRGNNSYK